MADFDGGFGSGAGAGSPGGTDVAVADGGTGASTAAGARTNLGLGTIATQDANNVAITGGSVAGVTDIAVADGGTGASTAAAARTNLNVPTLGSPTTPDANADNVVGATATTKKPLVLQVKAGQTANSFEIQDSANGVLFARGPGGRALPRYLTEYFEDYLWGTLGTASITSTPTGGCFLTRVTNAGTGQVVTRSTIGGRNTGISEATTGANSAGGGGHATGAAMLFGAGSYACEFSVRLEDLSDGTDTYTVYLGFVDFGASGTVAAPVDGAYVTYTHGTNSGKFQFVTINNSVATATDTGVTVAADTWYTIRIEVNEAGTSVTCTINGTASSGGAITTNIPTAAGRETGIGWGILKSAGTNPRLMYCDYVYYAVGGTGR